MLTHTQPWAQKRSPRTKIESSSGKDSYSYTIEDSFLERARPRAQQLDLASLPDLPLESCKGVRRRPSGRYCAYFNLPQVFFPIPSSFRLHISDVPLHLKNRYRYFCVYMHAPDRPAPLILPAVYRAHASWLDAARWAQLCTHPVL